MPKPALPSLAAEPWLRRDETQRVLAALAAAGHEGRIVGGAVRNALLGKPVADIDIATPATPQEVIKAAAASGLQVIPTGLAHGTVTVICNHVPHEVTTLRRDVATDGRHAIVAFTRDWTADAARRDFTINALYCDAAGTVHDPLDGYRDLAARRVRFIGSADARISEDYLRILRFFRFHAEHGAGEMDGEGLAACVRGRGGLGQLSAERIRAEMLKLAVATRALDALAAIRDHGLLLAVLGAVPRLGAFARLIAIEGALRLTPDAVRRIGCLSLHVAEDAGRLASRLRLSNSESGVLESLVCPQAMRLHAGLAERDAKILLYGMREAAWTHAALARWAWSDADVASEDWRQLLALPGRWPIPVFPVRGADLVALGLPAGPRVGDILRQLEAAWIAGDFTDGRAALLKQAALVLSEGTPTAAPPEAR